MIEYKIYLLVQKYGISPAVSFNENSDIFISNTQYLMKSNHLLLYKNLNNLGVLSHEITGLYEKIIVTNEIMSTVVI